MKVSNRLSHDQFVDLLQQDFDLIDCQEMYSQELFETGSVTMELFGKKYVISLVVDQVFY